MRGGGGEGGIRHNPRKKSAKPQSTRSSGHRRRVTLRAASKLPACRTLGCPSGPAKLGRGAERPGRDRRPLPSSSTAVPQWQAGAAAAALPRGRRRLHRAPHRPARRAAPRSRRRGLQRRDCPALRAGGRGRKGGPREGGGSGARALPELAAAPSPLRAKSGRRGGARRGLSPVRSERRAPAEWVAREPCAKGSPPGKGPRTRGSRHPRARDGHLKVIADSNLRAVPGRVRRLGGITGE